MKAHLESNIKDLLAGRPALGPVLAAAGIGCATCGLGTCRTQDILEIHNLDTEGARRLLTAMGEVIYGGRPFEVPLLVREARPATGGFCPPIARMVQEHTHILRFIRLIPDLVAGLRADPGPALARVAQGLDFIRNYADRYHHAKEEDVLFEFFDPGAEILQAMRDDHAQGRAHGAGMAAGLAQGDPERVAEHLQAYGALLAGHIHREDTILYPWMNRTLTTHQVGELFARCAEVDAAFGPGPRAHEAFVADLERTLGGS